MGDFPATKAKMSKPRKTSPPPPLHFITITEEPESMKSEFSYAVRSHAMQSFIHEKKNPKPKQAKSGISQSSDSNDQVQSPRQLSGRFKLSTWSRKSRKKAGRVGEQKSEEVETAASLEAEEMETVRLFKVACCSKITDLSHRVSIQDCFDPMTGLSFQFQSKVLPVSNLCTTASPSFFRRFDLKY